MKKIIIVLALLNFAVFAQNTFTDPRDGKKYKTVKIGKQTWMAQNLDYHGEDGYLGLCYGDKPKEGIRKPENCEIYGRLYDDAEAKKACPKRWHLPSSKEWQTLVDFAGGYEKAEKKLKAKNGWWEYDFPKESPEAPKCKWTEEKMDNRGRVIVTEHDYCVTDEYGFSALPGGYGDSDGSFDSVGSGGFWRSANESNSDLAYYQYMSYRSDDPKPWYYTNKSTLLSVRCVQD